jgi:hypothetical protein
MRAAVTSDLGKVTVVTIGDPTVGMRDVAIRVPACGQCGTDRHLLQGEFAPTLRIVPGHEAADPVVAVGGDVARHAIAERVAVDPSLRCSERQYCWLGRNKLCKRWQAIGVTREGGMTEYAAVLAASCVAVPARVRREQAPLIEPLFAIQGYDGLLRQFPSSEMIYGVRAIDLVMLESAQATGASWVHIINPISDRLCTPEPSHCPPFALRGQPHPCGSGRGSCRVKSRLGLSGHRPQTGSTFEVLWQRNLVLRSATRTHISGIPTTVGKSMASEDSKIQTQRKEQLTDNGWRPSADNARAERDVKV